MNRLPIVRVVFFRHGVAYLERRGEVRGHAALSVREGEMSDVLKSLAVSGPVRSVSYETPEDPDTLAARRGVPALFQEPLRALLHRLRGSVVSLDTRDGRALHGTLIGLEVRSSGEGLDQERVVLHDAGSLHLIDVADVRRVSPDDAELAGELDALLSHVRGQDRGQTRVVRLELDAESTAKVTAGYVIPAAPWRVVYRLHLDDERAEGVLSAFALLHNPTDESIEHADAILTTGEPQSFSLELHRPTSIDRAVVQETKRGGRAPARYERDMPKVSKGAMMSKMMAMPMPAPGADFGASLGGGGFAEAAESMPDQVHTDQRGELFEYRLSTPLTLGRGRSALVPLVSRRIAMKKERFYRADRGAHPDLVVRFENNTDLVLEEGAAVLYEGSDYSGEAMLPLTGKGSAARLAYGSDQALRCSIQERYDDVMVGLTLVDDDFVEQRRRERHLLLTVASERDDEATVMFEINKVYGYDPQPSAPEPAEQTAEARRYAITVGPRQTATLELHESQVHSVRVDADVVGPHVIAWVKSTPLDGSAGDWQRRLLQLVQARNEIERRHASARARREQLSERRQEIADELGSIGSETPEEMRVRARLAQQLEQLYETAQQHDAHIAQLQGELDAATAALAEHVRA